jgi:hypothetical protein
MLTQTKETRPKKNEGSQKWLPTGFSKSYQPVHSQSYTLGRGRSHAHNQCHSLSHTPTQVPAHSQTNNTIHRHSIIHLPTRIHSQPTIKSGPFTTVNSHMHCPLQFPANNCTCNHQPLLHRLESGHSSSQTRRS